MKIALSSATDLLRSVAGGDEQALIALYDRYRTILFGLLLRVLDNRAEAEDVLQTVFVQIWERAAGFDESHGQPLTWFVTLAHSLAVERRRLSGSRSVAAATRKTSQIACEDFTKTANSERCGNVRQGLQELPKIERDILLLAYFEGLSQSEIAEQTGVPLGTVKMRMRIGMTKLRDHLSISTVNLEISRKNRIHPLIETFVSRT